MTAKVFSAGVTLLAAAWLFAPAPVVVQAQTSTLQGVVTAQWGDPFPGAPQQPRTLASLRDTAGVTHAVTFTPGVLESVGGLRAINGRSVVLTGNAFAGPASFPEQPSFIATSVQLDPAPLIAGPQAITGSQAFVTVLCKFQDISAEPRNLAFFNGLMGTAYPGMDHYWREVSYNNINILGSQNVNWVTMARPRSAYVTADSVNLNLLAQDCANAADSQVFFPNFVGINFVFNEDIGCCAWGGGVGLTTADAPARVWRATWMPPWAQESGVFGHEMGHAFGLPHSSGPYGATYDSQWDVMSGAQNPYVETPPYGPTPQHTIMYHKDLDAWVPTARRFVASSPGTYDITIERSALPTSGNTYLMARIPIAGSSTRFYTVEGRRFVGYDNNLPSEGIIIHDVQTTGRANPAQVVDATNDNNPNDAGAVWVPGETFTGTGGITVAVLSANATGWGVRITIPSPCGATISPSTASVSNTGGSGSIGVTIAAGCAWTASSNASWLTVTSGASGTGNGVAWYSAAFNPTPSARTGTLTVAGRTFTVSQVPSTTRVRGDMNADALPDILWHHRVSGGIATWFMAGANRLDAALLNPSAVADLTWQPVGLADFNDDGRSDVLWQNVNSGDLFVWFMNGLIQTDGSYLSHRLPDPRWRVRSVTDLNGDGSPDIVIQHPQDGLIAAWLMNGVTMVDGSLLNPGFVSPDWRVAGSGDFNADGRMDLVFQHNEGGLAVWYMNGLTRLDAVWLNPASIADTRWLVSAVTDVNGDTKPDLVLHHVHDGVAAVWFMDGISMVDGRLFSPAAVPDTNWRIIGPR